MTNTTSPEITPRKKWTGPISDLISIHIWYIVGSIVTLGFGIGGFFSKALMNLEENNASP
jgi:hypothetical protein